MKRLLLSIVATASILSAGLYAVPVYADGGVKFDPSSAQVNDIGGCTGAAASSSLCTDLKSNKNPLFGPDGVLTKVAGIFALLTGVISVFMIIISGLRYITSGGDPAKTKSARDGIIYSAVGIMVSLLAGSVVRFILSKL